MLLYFAFYVESEIFLIALGLFGPHNAAAKNIFSNRDGFCRCGTFNGYEAPRRCSALDYPRSFAVFPQKVGKLLGRGMPIWPIKISGTT